MGNNKNAKTLDTFAAELIASGGGCDQSDSSEVRSRNAIDTNTHTHIGAELVTYSLEFNNILIFV